MDSTQGQSEEITAVGVRQLQQELEYLRDFGRIEIAERVREVRAQGNLPALLDVLDQQAQLEYRIAGLREHMAVATGVGSLRDGSASGGNYLHVRDVDTGVVTDFELVAEIDSDISGGRLSIETPLGTVLARMQPGTTTRVETPHGVRRLELLTVSPAPPLPASF